MNPFKYLVGYNPTNGRMVPVESWLPGERHELVWLHSSCLSNCGCATSYRLVSLKWQCVNFITNSCHNYEAKLRVLSRKWILYFLSTKSVHTKLSKNLQCITEGIWTAVFFFSSTVCFGLLPDVLWAQSVISI